MVKILHYAGKAVYRLAIIKAFVFLLVSGVAMADQSTRSVTTQIASLNTVASEIEKDAMSRISAVEAEYTELVGLEKPKGYSHCRWVDIKAVKQDMSFYVSKFEDAILGCKDQWAPHTTTVWQGRARAKNSSDPNDYEIAIDVLRGSRYQESAQNSAVRDLTDKVVSLYESGASQETTMLESYSQCVSWAELDPDQILSGREYKPLSNGDLAIAKGLLSCD